MNVLLCVQDHGPSEVEEIDTELAKLAERQAVLLKRRAVLEQLIAIAQAHDAPQLEVA